MATDKQKAEATPPAEINRRAQQAAALRDNPMWQEILDEIENDLIMAFRMSSFDDTETRERSHAMLNATQSIRRIIQTAIQSGQLRGRARSVAEGKQ